MLHLPCVLACERQIEPECRALSFDTVDADLALHGFDQLLADRQPESGAAEAPCCRAVGLREGLEKLPLFVERNADTGIFYAEAQHVCGACDPDQNRSRRCEFQRVVDEIAEDLADPHRIPGNARRYVSLD